jgi:hypothetical protein
MNKNNKLKKLNKGQTDKDLLEVANFLNIKITKIDFINELFKDNNKLENGNYIGNLDSKTHLDNQLFSEFKGALAEQYVLQELKAAGQKNVFYWLPYYYHRPGWSTSAE